MSAKAHEHRKQLKATAKGAFHKRRPAGTKVVRAGMMGVAGGANKPPGSSGMTKREAVKRMAR